MTRTKVKLAFITNDTRRRTTLNKRKKGLLKKAKELSTLCGIDACVIIYSPGQSQPDVWPNVSGAQLVLHKFQRMPEMEQSKKMVNQEGFTRQRILKARDQLKKKHKENREKEMTSFMYGCLTRSESLQGLMMGDLKNLGWLLNKNLEEIYKRIESLNNMPPLQLTPPPPTLPVPPTSEEVAFGAGEMSQVGEHVPYKQNPTTVDFLGMHDGMMTSEEVALGTGEMADIGVHVPYQQNPTVDYSGMYDGMMTIPQWFPEFNNPIKQLGFDNTEQLMMPYGDNHDNTLWTSAFFP